MELKEELKQTIINILNKEDFNERDEIRLQETKKLILQIEENETNEEIEKLRIEQARKKFNDAMAVLKESKAISKLAECAQDYIKKSYQEKKEIEEARRRIADEKNSASDLKALYGLLNNDSGRDFLQKLIDEKQNENRE